MATLVELSTEECIDLLRDNVVGRAAICTPGGPHVVPVNYTVHGDAIVFRTQPYSVLGTYAWTSDIAFEVDHVDPERRLGWSVVVVGRGEMVEDVDELEAIRLVNEPTPWADGPRRLYVRLRWSQVSGRRLV